MNNITRENITSVDFIRINNRFYIINNITFIIQTILIFYMRHIDDIALNSMLYILYFMNICFICPLTCPITRNLFSIYLYMNIIFDVYYIYIYSLHNVYIKEFWFIIFPNSANLIYIYKNNINNINNSMIIIDNDEYNTGEIILTDDDLSSSSGDEIIDINDDANVDDDTNVDEDTNVGATNVGDDANVDDETNVGGKSIIKQLGNNKLKDECIICFTKFSKKETVTTKCGHTFHNRCLRKWLKVDDICPICRTRTPLNK